MQNPYQSSKKLEEIILIIKNLIKYKKVLYAGESSQVVETHFSSTKSTTRTYKKNLKSFLKKNRQKFEVVTYVNILNKFASPKGILIKTKTILAKNGVILVLVPNTKALIKVRQKGRSQHIFSTKSIKVLLKKAGYEIKYLTTFDSLKDFEKRFKKSYLYVVLVIIYLLVRKIAWSFKYGGLICVIAQKK